MWRAQMEDDAEAFALLVQRWQEPIFRLCARMVGDASRAEDLTQEIFAKVFTKRREFKPDSKFSTWLWRVALNHCYDELRRLKRRNETSLDEEVESEFAAVELTPDAQAAIDEECDLVRRGLMRLPEILRTVLALRYCEGLKLREIGEILDLPESTVQSRVALGLAQITRILEPQLRQKSAKHFPQVVL